MNDCNKCIWARRDGGCNSWDCTFIDQTEAANAYTDRLYKRVKESPVMVLRQPECKTGRWIQTHRGEKGFSRTGFRCDQCGEVNPRSNYCPNCGADMRKEGEANG